jgi:hypothetical protein
MLRKRRRLGIRGAVIVEYSLLLLAVGIPASLGILTGGKIMWDAYGKAKSGFLSPLP